MAGHIGVAAGVLIAVALIGFALPAISRAAWSAQTLPGSVRLAQPKVAINARGDAVIAWSSTDGRIRAALRRGDASAFARPVVIGAGERSGATTPLTVAMTAGGDAIALWAHTTTQRPRYRIEAAIARHGRPFAQAKTIAASTTALRADPRLAAGAGGTVIAGWHRDDVGLALAVRKPGHGFGRPLTPLTLPGADVKWTAAADGRVHLVWAAEGPGGTFIASSSGRLSAGSRWTPFHAISGIGRSAPMIAASASDALVAVFRVGQPDEGGPARAGEIEAATAAPGRLLGGAGGTATRIGSASQSGADITLAAGPHGSAAVGWGGSGSNWPTTLTTPLAWIATRAAGSGLRRRATACPRWDVGTGARGRIRRQRSADCCDSHPRRAAAAAGGPPRQCG